MNSSDTPSSYPGPANATGTRADRHFDTWHSIATVVALVLLTIITWGLYAPGLGGGFIFDDYPNIVDNILVHPRHASLSELTAAALSSPSSELKRPLASLSFAANFLISGLDPAAMKATNIVLHILNGWLVFCLCRSLWRHVHPRDSSCRRDLLAFIVALAWLTAPINLTAVLYVVQRMESVANLFVLIGLIGYVRLRMRVTFRTRDTAIAAVWLLACTGAGVLAKETAVLLPLYALCAETTLFRFGIRGSRERASLFVLYTAILGLPFIAGSLWIVPSLLDPHTWATRDYTLATRLMSEPRIVLDYIAWTIAPTARGLSFYHDGFIASSDLLTPWTTLPSMVTLVLLALGAWFTRRRAPLLSLGILWFFACHTLTATILPLELVYEHRNYFASLGVIMALVEAFRLFANREPSSRLHLVLLLLPLSLIAWSMTLTFTTADAWGRPLSLAEELGRRGPTSHRAQYELGRAYIIASRYDRSSPYIAKAVPPLEAAAAMPDASILAEQALIFVYARAGLPIKKDWWTSIRTKLLARPATVQDESALGALAQCLQQEACHFEAGDLRDAFNAAMDQPAPSARLCAIYGDFAASTLADPVLALQLTETAVQKAPSEPAYRINLARRAIANGHPRLAHEQVDALRRMNFGGRLDSDITALDGELSADARRRLR